MYSVTLKSKLKAQHGKGNMCDIRGHLQAYPVFGLITSVLASVCQCHRASKEVNITDCKVVITQTCIALQHNHNSILKMDTSLNLPSLQIMPVSKRATLGHERSLIAYLLIRCITG